MSGVLHKMWGEIAPEVHLVWHLKMPFLGQVLIPASGKLQRLQFIYVPNGTL